MERDTILFYYGEKKEDRKYNQYEQFTAPYAIESQSRPNALIVDAALLIFRIVAAFANHKPQLQCSVIQSFRLFIPLLTILETIVTTKDIRSGREICVDYGGNYRMHGHAGCVHHVTQPKRQKKPVGFINVPFKK